MMAEERGSRGRKETSGLLMSVIRALSSSSSLEQREKEKQRVEKEFRESDRRLDNLVAENYEDLTSIIKAFSTISDRVQASRDRIAKVKDNLLSCKNLLHCKRDELRKLWIEGVEQRTVVEMMERIENIKEVPEKLNGYMEKKHYLHAAELITNAVSLLEGDLVEVEGLRDLKVDLISKKKHLFEVIVDELHTQIYVKTTEAKFNRQGSGRRDKKDGGGIQRALVGKLSSGGQNELQVPSSRQEPHLVVEELDVDPEEDQPHFIGVLVESLAILKRLSTAVEVIRHRMKPELLGLIHRAAQQIVEIASQQGENVLNQHQPRHLLELLELVIKQFRSVAHTHQLVLQHLKRTTTSASPDEPDITLYGIVEVWGKIQEALQIFLGDYLDMRNTAATQQQTASSFEEHTDIASYFARRRTAKPKKAPLFRFEASSHAISMHSYFEEQKQDFYGPVEAMPSSPTRGAPYKQTFVCKPTANNITENYEDLTSIIKAFSTISDRVQASRDRIAKVKDNLLSCKNLLHCKRDELRKLWIEGVEQRTVVEMMERIENIKEVPEKLNGYMEKKHYLHAAELITNAVSLLEGDLVEVEGLRDLKVDLISKKKHLFEVIVDELHTQIYVKTTEAKFNRQGSGRRDKKDGGGIQRALVGKLSSGGQNELQVPSSRQEPHLVVEELDVDPEEDQPHFIGVLVESLAILKRLSTAVEVIRHKMKPELLGLIHRAAQQIVEIASQQGENVLNQHQPRHLLELLELVIKQFRSVAHTHQLVLQHLKRTTTSASPDEPDITLYGIVEVWGKIQEALQIFLGDYLDMRNTAATQQQTASSFEEHTDIASYFARRRTAKPKKAPLFRFEASSHAISMHSYFEEQKQDFYGPVEAMPSSPTRGAPYKQTFVCKPTANNITAIYNPLQQFIQEIEAATGCQAGASPLQSFITEFVKKTFLGQVHYNIMSDIATATKGTEGKGFDAMRFVTDQKTQKELNVPKPLLQSTVAVYSCIQDLHHLMQDLPDYGDQFLDLIGKILKDYKDTCQMAYIDIVQPDSEDNRIISAMWAKDEDISRLLRSLPNWLYLQNEKELKPVDLHFSEADMRAMNSKESEILTGNLSSSETTIPLHEIISDSSQLRTLGNLHESLEWFSNKMKEFVHNLPASPRVAVGKGCQFSKETMQSLLTLAQDFQELADMCLLVLHLEVRVHCFYYIIPVAKSSNYSGALDDMDPDANVLKLNKDLTGIEEAMSQSLQPRKFMYIFDGLGHLIATLLISSAQFLTRINENGIKKMCRNIFAMQQNLSNITSSREVDLDRARQYYELLHLSLEEILTSIVEQGPQFSELEYTHIFSLRQRSRPGSDPKVFKGKLDKLKEVLREHHV
ncbi:exocyst complex component 4 [Lingula anatina]|uniref:Exocyst complex component Sec8 n=1 Tax=Lingula anatina TaxID=7574 RepID=A0A2R2MIL2_LINAN|nr:exocyst complex component 4 [Lingula anatina]|eukprot:XP_023930065.1 exocyst complex component 4 [Lingula anatina]